MSDQPNVPWFYIIALHIVAGPLLLMIIFGLAFSYPNFAENLPALIGLILIVVPVVAAILFGVIPFMLLGIIVGLLIKTSVQPFWAVIVIAGIGALFGSIWPKLLQGELSEENILALLIPSAALTAVICYYFCRILQSKRIRKTGVKNKAR